MGPAEDCGVRIGVAMTILGFGALIGPPISGAIQRSGGGFEAVGAYAGEFLWPYNNAIGY